MWGPIVSSLARAQGASRTGLRLSRFTGAVVVDTLIVVVAFHLALVAQDAGVPSTAGARDLWRLLPFGVAAFLLTHLVTGIYHRMWRFAGFSDLLTVIGAGVIATFVSTMVSSYWIVSNALVPSTILLGGFLSLAGLAAYRFRRRLLAGVGRGREARPAPAASEASRQRVLVVGAGEAGRLLIDRFEAQREGQRYEPVGLVDDDPAKRGLRFRGLKVMGDRHAIPDLVGKRDIDLIVIAIYNVSGPDFREIVEICEQTDAVIKVLPNLFDFLQGRNGVAPIRDVTVEDLLGRSVVEIDDDACRELLAGKTVLVTGAAGSIGSELCRQVIRFGPARLVMVDNNETGLHDLVIGDLKAEGRRLAQEQGDEEGSALTPVVGDVTNRAKMQTVFGRYRPDIVFHAAAYKHVPLMEEHPDEAVFVNVLGTRICAELAAAHDVERFVLVSTDKAINPTSVMGATKRVCEVLVTDGGARPTTVDERTRFTAVRFGNVLGSRGSVVPTFERQIGNGGPVTITHPEMTRYFMAIAEAASLIIQAAVLTEGGDIFMLEMGQRIRIDDLARRMIRMRGLRPEVDIPVVYTGPRSGEKMHEELLGRDEISEPTAHPHIFRTISATPNGHGTSVAEQVEHLIALAEARNNDELVGLLSSMVGRRAGAAAGQQALAPLTNATEPVEVGHGT